MRQIHSGLSRVARRDGAETLGEVQRSQAPAVLLVGACLLSDTYRLTLCHTVLGGIL